MSRSAFGQPNICQNCGQGGRSGVSIDSDDGDVFFCFADECHEVFLDVLKTQRAKRRQAHAEQGLCIFSIAWRGLCTKARVQGHSFCEEHLNTQCVICHGQATHGCSATSSFVCGNPLCGDHRCPNHST